ncbi:MAG: hypothetical protein E7I84_12625 [Staphylococcus warneri]|nr:hypothetical protein [Staphylococcus warneri]
MDNNEKKITVKIPESVLNLFREVYNLSDDVYNNKLVLYAIASSLPENGRRLFAQDFSLDEDTLSGIIKKRKRLTNESRNKEFKNIENKLDSLGENLKTNESSENQLQMIQILLRLLLADNFSLGTDRDSLNEYLNSLNDKNIMEFVQDKIK